MHDIALPLIPNVGGCGAGSSSIAVPSFLYWREATHRLANLAIVSLAGAAARALSHVAHNPIESKSLRIDIWKELLLVVGWKIC